MGQSQEKNEKVTEKESELISSIESQFESVEISSEEGFFSFIADRENFHDILSTLKDKGFDHLSDIAGIDYIDEEEFELIYHLWSHEKKLRCAVKVQVPRESPSIKTIVDLWKGAQIHERENHEMFGVDFEGNPNLTQLFLEDWEEIPPFRKDFDTREYVKEKYYGGKYEYGE